MPRHPSRPQLRWEATPLRRRTVLLGMGAAGAATLLGCPKPAPPPPPPAPTLFDGFRSVRGLIRSSPDHLAARAAEVIASRDFTRAVRFVRDQIAVVPPAHSYDAATDAVRWGPDAALRAGAGTVRERAELLKAMLTAMGATAAVKRASWPAGVDAAALYRTRPPRFSVELSALHAASDVTSTLANANQPFPDGDADALMTALLGRLPAGQAVAKQPFDGVDTTAPVVEYTANGATKWAFAMGEVDEVAAAPAGLGSELIAPSYPTASVRLLASMGDLPGVPNPPGLVELAKGSWTTEQLAGSRLLVTTAAADPDQSVGTPRDQLTVRVPVMRVQPATPLLGGDPALWTPKAAPAAATAGGNPFTLSGARFAAGASPTDPPVGPYGAAVKLDGTAHPAALARVASLQAVANGGAFPDVLLTVSALDQGGAPVFGLTQADFAIADEGAAEGATLLSNAGVEQLKVMLSYDCSGSITWPTPADKTAFDDALANALVASAQTTPYLLGVAPVGGGPLGGYVAPDTTGIKAAIASCSSFSDVWATLGQIAPAAGCSAVVLASDFQASDDPAAIPAFAKRLRASGLAVALVPVSTGVDQATVAALVSACDAVVLDPLAVDFQAKLTAFVSAATAKAKVSGYRFSYRVPADQRTNQGSRTAKVSLAGAAAVAANAPYQVPAAAARGSVGIAGLYLELQVAGSVTTTRRLSGPGLDRFGTPLAAVADDYAATRDLLSGVVTVAFEPGSPTTAANAEDLLACALSIEPLQAACAAGKTQREGLAVAKAMQIYSGVLAGLVEPPPPADAGPAVAPQALRVVVLSEAAGYHGFSRRVDVVPDLNLGVAATADAAAAFTAAMRSTLRLSLREAALLPSSAAGALAGATLQYLAPNGDPSTLTGFTPAELARWSRVFDQYGSWHRLVPTTPAAGAMWLVHPDTGATVAVFVDGSGGGDCSNAAWNAGIQEALALLQLCIAYRGAVCDEPDAGPYACVGALVATVYAGVAALFAAALLDGITGLDVMVMIIGLVGGALPGIGGAVGIVVAIMGLVVAQTEVAQSLGEHC